MDERGIAIFCIAVVLVLFFLFTVPKSSSSDGTCKCCPRDNPKCSCCSGLELWDDHYYLTREVMRDAATESKCLDADVEKLLENQKKLGDYFGVRTKNLQAAKELTNELTTHIKIALDLVNAAAKQKPTDEIYKKWQNNATTIAGVYAKYDRKIDFGIMNDHMQSHLITTLAEAQAILSGDCVASQKTGEIALEHIRKMSKYIDSR
jgi:hypothetical protein